MKNILLVDDSEAEQFLYKSIVEIFNPEINVVSAYDGEEAIEILDKHDAQFDVILLDINMPKVNGFEFLETYKENFNNSHIIVAMVTSSGQTKDKDKAMASGVVNKYFEKPLTLDNLEELKTLVMSERPN